MIPNSARQNLTHLLQEQEALENALVQTMKDIVFSDISDSEKAAAVGRVINQGKSKANDIGLSIDFDGLLDKLSEAIQNLTKEPLTKATHLTDTEAESNFSWFKLSQKFSKR